MERMNVKRKREDVLASAIIGRDRLTDGLRTFYERIEAAKTVNNLTNDDIQELSKILHYAVRAQSSEHQVSPRMMQRFVDAVFEDWSKTSNHLDPPKAVEEVPYRTTEYQFGDIAVDASDSDPNLNTPWCEHIYKPNARIFLQFDAHDKASLQYWVSFEAEDRSQLKCPIRRRDIPYSAHVLDEEALTFLAYPCATYNSQRAVQYARFYLQREQCHSSVGEGRDYKFFQLPAFIRGLRRQDIYEEDELDAQECDKEFCVDVPMPAPLLFGERADEVSQSL